MPRNMPINKSTTRRLENLTDKIRLEFERVRNPKHPPAECKRGFFVYVSETPNEPEAS